MRSKNAEREETEYRDLVLPGDPSDASAKTLERKAERLPKESDPELLANQICKEMEQESEQMELELILSGDPSDVPAETLAREAEKPSKESDLELLAKQIRKEMEQEGEQPEPGLIFPGDRSDAPIEKPARKPKKMPEEKAPEEKAPEEPDLELLAKQIRGEIEQDAEQTEPEKDDKSSADGEASAEETQTTEQSPEEDPEESPEEVRIRRIRSVFEYLETFCVALGVMILLFMFVFRYVSVDGDSMLPTLHGGDSSDHADRLIISGFLYTPKTGDVVVINTGTSEQPLIKRVIAVGGQTVRINFNSWEVTVDGVRLDEDYIWYRDGQPMVDRDMASMYGMDENGICEFTVSEGKVFVMGDNRNNSKDSRFREIGEQDVEHILGKVILRLYPFGEFGTV